MMKIKSNVEVNGGYIVYNSHTVGSRMSEKMRMTNFRYDNDNRLPTALCDSRQLSAHASDIRYRHTTIL